MQIRKSFVSGMQGRCTTGKRQHPTFSTNDTEYTWLTALFCWRCAGGLGDATQVGPTNLHEAVCHPGLPPSEGLAGNKTEERTCFPTNIKTRLFHDHPLEESTTYAFPTPNPPRPPPPFPCVSRGTQGTKLNRVQTWYIQTLLSRTSLTQSELSLSFSPLESQTSLKSNAGYTLPPPPPPPTSRAVAPLVLIVSDSLPP